jgi:hypothetical protein
VFVVASAGVCVRVGRSHHDLGLSKNLWIVELIVLLFDVGCVRLLSDECGCVYVCLGGALYL